MPNELADSDFQNLWENISPQFGGISKNWMRGLPLGTKLSSVK